jgi:DNA ligase D
MASSEAFIEINERNVRVSSPERVIFAPTSDHDGLTKLDVAQYYAAVGPAMMNSVRDRPAALERWPKGLGDEMFYQKRPMRGAPAWAEHSRVWFASGRRAEQLSLSEPAALVWAAHMGTVTFHPWPTRSTDNDHPDELRIDLDPFGNTRFEDAVQAALSVREILADVGITPFVKTSGKRGVHVYVRLEPKWTFTDVRHAAIGLARTLERRVGGVTTAWWKEERGDNVFVDFNQNCRDRTIAAAYSLRPTPEATVSTPLTWDELATVSDPREFTLASVPERLASVGDPWAAIDDVAHSLEPLLDMWHEDPREMPYPPEHPKMPGEPKRVQPSRAKEST